ncbi:MAG TPA: tetratricopeptide repeat protein, partial [Steroidobacteraceae bacterium]|nr:tetratricopeptide repeat protein [Steroidobacteraceae bacterium]
MRIRIGEWLADEQLDEISRGDERVKLDRRTMELLMYLAAKPREVISTDELLDQVWRGVVVAPSSVYQTIAVLRRALGDDAEQPRYIATVQRRGYRLIAKVERPPAPAPAPEPEPEPGGLLRRWSWKIPLAAVVILGGAVYLLAEDSIHRRLFAPEPGDRSIAVLPFESLDRDPADSYLADGMTEGLLQTLGRLPGVRVTARSSVFAFRQRQVDVRQIARALSVRYLLDGTFRRDGEDMHLGVQLVDGKSGFELWSATYDRPLAEAMLVQDEISRAVARALELVLTRDVASRLARGLTLDSVAVDAYLRGRAYWSERSAVSLRSAREHYERAIQRDPRIAAAHVGMAELLVLLPFYGVETPSVAFPQARVAALRALELDPDLAEAHATLAVVLYQYEWNWIQAEAEFRRALVLNPNYATARQWYAEFLSYSGRADDAEAQIAVARDLDPLSPTIATLRGSPAFWARRFAEAEHAFSDALENHPDFPLAHYSLAMSRLALGRAEEALDSFAAARPGLQDEFVIPSLAHALVAAGRRDEAAVMLEALLAGERERYISSYKVAVLLAGLGQHEAALARLERARRERDDRLVLIAVDPMLDTLRGDVRFQDLQREVIG